MNYWRRWIGAIQAKTGHLSCAAMGVYDRLLDHYYSTEEPLPGDLDACCRIARAMTKDERKAVVDVLREFFDLGADGLYRQGRTEEEIADAQPKIEAARSNGKKGGRPKKNPTGTEGKPSGFPPGTQGEPEAKALQRHPSSLRSEVSKASPSHPGAAGGLAGRFERFWQAYPRKVGKKDARRKFDGLKPDDRMVDAMLEAIAEQRQSEQWRKDAGQFIPHPATWLHQGRWEDETGVETPEAAPPQSFVETRDWLAKERAHAAEVERQRMARIASRAVKEAA